jgi:hypothetical protein
MEARAIKDLIPDAIARSTTTAKSATTGWTPRLDAYHPSLVAARDACARLVADMERGADPYWLTLTGLNGCGKTMLMRQVFIEAKRINPGNPANNGFWPPDALTSWSKGVNTYTASRPYCIWLDESQLARRMRSGEYDLPVQVRGDYFVALDEIGVARDPTNFVADAVASLCENRLGRWGMFATNLTLPEIAERIDARVTSRLIRDGNRVVTIEARDYALRREA